MRRLLVHCDAAGGNPEAPLPFVSKEMQRVAHTALVLSSYSFGLRGFTSLWALSFAPP